MSLYQEEIYTIQGCINDPKVPGCCCIFLPESVSENLKKCKRCTRKFYCSRECQVEDWKNHKRLCTKIHTANQIETSILLLLELKKYMDKKDYTSVLTFKNDGLHIATDMERKRPDVSAQILGFFGVAILNSGDYDSALAYLKKSDSLYMESNIAKFCRNHGNVSFYMADCLSRMGDYTGACKEYTRGKEMCQTNIDFKMLMSVETHIATIHLRNSEFEIAIPMFRRAQERAFLEGETRDKILITRNLGTSLLRKGLYKEAITQYEYIVNCYEEMNMEKNLYYAGVLELLGRCWYLLGKFDTAIECYSAFFDISSENDNKEGTSTGALDIAMTLFEISRPNYPTCDMLSIETWLQIALCDIDKKPEIKTDVYPTIKVYAACLAYLQNNIIEAVLGMKELLDKFTEHSREYCASCKRRRTEGTNELMKCGGCKTASLHQEYKDFVTQATNTWPRVNIKEYAIRISVFY